MSTPLMDATGAAGGLYVNRLAGARLAMADLVQSFERVTVQRHASGRDGLREEHVQQVARGGGAVERPASGPRGGVPRKQRDQRSLRGRGRRAQDVLAPPLAAPLQGGAGPDRGAHE